MKKLLAINSKIALFMLGALAIYWGLSLNFSLINEDCENLVKSGFPFIYYLSADLCFNASHIQTSNDIAFVLDLVFWSTIVIFIGSSIWYIKNLEEPDTKVRKKKINI